jgi:hypothetical protein
LKAQQAIEILAVLKGQAMILEMGIQEAQTEAMCKWFLFLFFAALT